MTPARMLQASNSLFVHSPTPIPSPQQAQERTRNARLGNSPSMLVFPIRVDVRDHSEDLPARHGRLVVGPRPGLLLRVRVGPRGGPRVDRDLDVLRRAGDF